jgi:hypothetical protein
LASQYRGERKRGERDEQEGHVVGPDVEDDVHNPRRVDASSESVYVALPNRDEDTADTLITDTEDSCERSQQRLQASRTKASR